MGVFILTLNPVWIFIVSFDYCIRAFVGLKYSPVRLVAVNIIKVIGLNKKLINLAPKIFASRLGFICAFTASILIALQFYTISLMVAGLLMILSIMDSLFNICVGCLIYNYLVYPLMKMEQ